MNKIIPLIVLLIAGCGTDVTHNTHRVLDTHPQGASVVCDGQELGYSPIINTVKNTEALGENRAITDEEASHFLASVYAVHIALMSDKNLEFMGEADRGVVLGIEELKDSLEFVKIVRGELKAGENKFYTDEEVIKLMKKTEDEAGEKNIVGVERYLEAVKVARGEVKAGEGKILSDEEIMGITGYVNSLKDKHYIGDCTAYWSSGVSKKFPYSFAPPYRYIGKGIFIYTLRRPEGEGYSQDAEFALKVQQLKQNQQNADRDAAIALRAVQAQESAALASVIKESTSAIQTIQNIKSIDSNKATTTCFTNLGITTCY